MEDKNVAVIHLDLDEENKEISTVIKGHGLHLTSLVVMSYLENESFQRVFDAASSTIKMIKENPGLMRVLQYDSKKVQ